VQSGGGQPYFGTVTTIARYINGFLGGETFTV
jgi:hypothetical protein